MSQRERPTSHGSAVHPAATAGNGAPVAWNDLYDRLPHDQRARLIASAVNGVVPADQVPPPPTAPPLHLLQRLLAGDGLDDLPPLPETNISELPPELNVVHRAAVALALQTPDIALIEGQPETCATRIAPAVATGAARRGERILLIAPDAATLDRNLAPLVDRPDVCILRCVGRDESESKLPPHAAGCTFAAHSHRLTEQAREHAEVRLVAAREASRRRDAEAAVYDHILDLAEQHHRLQARRAEALERSEQPVLSTERSTLNADAGRLDAERARQAVTAIEQTLVTLRPLAAARKSGRWWTPSWWRARSAGDVTAQLAELEAKHRQAQTYAHAIEAEFAGTADKTSLPEGGRAQDAPDPASDEVAVLDREITLVADKWGQAVRQLPATGPRPAGFTPDAAAAARDQWGRGRDAARRDLDAAHAWADGLELLLEALPGRLLEAVNLVAATPTALAADPHFGDGRRGPFDLLIVIATDAFADADLLAIARRARRWVLFGVPNRGGFARLWTQLHRDPWVREGERVICRLRSVPADRRNQLEREPVADRPDIELRIHTPVGGEPELAEVAFPAGTSFAHAMEYLFKELGELPPALGLGLGRTIRLDRPESTP